MSLGHREYQYLLLHRDPERVATKKKRRCFISDGRYFQLDIYDLPPPQMSQEFDGTTDQKKLCILETFTTIEGQMDLPSSFLEVDLEITGLPEYSLYNMSFAKRRNMRKTTEYRDVPNGNLGSNEEIALSV